jgi:hypothetical protein
MYSIYKSIKRKNKMQYQCVQLARLDALGALQIDQIIIFEFTSILHSMILSKLHIGKEKITKTIENNKRKGYH